MAYHFSANQFEDVYGARKLRNWEYPKWFPDRPRQRTTTTKIIANDQGHLLDGVQKENPWGNYLGTWDLPKRITREYAEKLAAPPEKLVNLWDKKKQCAHHAPPPPAPFQHEEPEHLPSLRQRGSQTPEESFQRRNRSSTALDLRPEQVQKLEPLVPSPTSDKNRHNISPGSLDERVKRIIESVEQQTSPPLIAEQPCKAAQTLPTRWREKEPDPTKFPPPEPVNGVNADPNPNPKEDSREYMTCLDDHLDKFEKVTSEREPPKKIDLSRFEKNGSAGSTRRSSGSKKMVADKDKPSKYGGPLINDYSSFQIAKRFHDDNLKHQPLPDMIEDPVFKALGSNRHPYPGNALNVEPNASAIGWRGYNEPGPTQCSKLKVYRPKTAADKIKAPKEFRPKTSDPKREKRKKRFTQMDLAICWDLKPDNPADEPKRSPHIDGSNGSAAPAVFAVVHPDVGGEKYENILGSAQAVAEHIPRGVEDDNVGTLPPKIGAQFEGPPPMVTNKEAIMARIKPPVETPPKHRKTRTPDHQFSVNSLTPNGAEIARTNPKTAWTDHDTSKALSERLLDLQKENQNPNVMKRNCAEKRSGSIDARKKNSNFDEMDLLKMTRRKHYQSSPNLATIGCQTKNCNGSNCGTEKNCSGSNCGTLKNCNGSNCGSTKNCNGSNCGSVKSCSGSNCGSSKNCVGSNCGSTKNFIGLNCNNAKNYKRSGKKKDRNCVACDKSDSDSDQNRGKLEYKMAFKAGMPKHASSNSGSPCAAKPVKIPKMRPPYAKRSYSIGTLVPPFSLWPDHHGQEYPEHWRLASVYQHSYKPLDNRRKPLLASVYQ